MRMGSLGKDGKAGPLDKFEKRKKNKYGPMKDCPYCSHRFLKLHVLNDHIQLEHPGKPEVEYV